MDRIERLKDLIPKLKANKKIQPLKIECLEWELKYLESEKKQLSICDVVSSKKPYYMLVNKNGNPITTDSKLPIFWLKKIARKEAVKFNTDIKKIYL